MSFVEEFCFHCPYTEEVAKECHEFHCGEADLDDFFSKDAFEYEEFRMGKSYCIRLNDEPKTIVAIYTVSSDSIRIFDLPRSRRDAMLKITHHRKRLKRYPGILIGRLGVNSEFAHQGIGSQVLDVIKLWFDSSVVKAGCRFLIVDALNKPNVLAFYRKNGFETLFTSEQQEDFYVNPPKDEEQRLMRLANPIKLETRLMFTDLLKD
jgi:ribosomal protein S18 acetylase RimI-like enzyme